jgi:hypothetical protein
MEKEKLIYISGKMGSRRLSKATIVKFEVAQNKLLKEGWVVVNPASQLFQLEAQEHVRIEEAKWQDLDFGHFDWYAWMLLWDMHHLALADAIYLLRDWRESPGATTEFFFAKACGKEILYEEEPKTNV